MHSPAVKVIVRFQRTEATGPVGCLWLADKLLTMIYFVLWRIDIYAVDFSNLRFISHVKEIKENSSLHGKWRQQCDERPAHNVGGASIGVDNNVNINVNMMLTCQTRFYVELSELLFSIIL